MDVHVLSAIPTSTKQDWGLHLALLFHQTLPLRLEASLTPRVSATPGTRGQTELRVHSAHMARTKRDRGLLFEQGCKQRKLRISEMIVLAFGSV